MNRDIQSNSAISLNMRKMKEQKAEVEAAFNDCSTKIHNFEREIQIFNYSINKAIESQGKGYSLLDDILEWLQSIYNSACEKEAHLQGILQEAQNAFYNTK